MGNRFLNGEAHQRQRRRNAIFMFFQYSFVMGLLIGFLVHISRCSFLGRDKQLLVLQDARK